MSKKLVMLRSSDGFAHWRPLNANENIIFLSVLGVSAVNFFYVFSTSTKLVFMTAAPPPE
jgi:hypothetical protein